MAIPSKMATFAAVWHGFNPGSMPGNNKINLLSKLSVKMNHYETVFILTPVLSDAQMKEAVEKFTTVLTENGATIVNEEIWGLRKLAYPIQKKSTGFYARRRPDFGEKNRDRIPPRRARNPIPRFPQRQICR